MATTKVTQVMEEAAALDHEAQRDAEVLSGLIREDKPETANPPRRRRATTASTDKAAANGSKTPARSRKAPAPATETADKPAPARRTRTASKPAATAKTPAPAKGKAAKQPAQPAPAPESNGTSARLATQAMAVELIDLVAGHFSGRSVDEQTKIANWLKVLPTGGAGWERYWPEGFARPTTSDWRKPE